MRHATNPLPHLLESFFCEHLQRARGASPRTVHAYRDTLRLLLIYLAETAGCAVAQLQPAALQVEAIAAFLTYLVTV
jgi:integrase/recombinase XerD